MTSSTSLQLGTLVRYAIFLFLLFEVLAGPLRYYLALHDLPALIYVPKLVMIVTTILLLLSGKIAAPQFYAVCAIFVVYLLIGLADLPDSSQAPFALWSMVPLLFSIATAKYFFRDLPHYKTMFLILYVIVIGGIALNYFHNVPWSGSGFRLAGQHIVSSRAWTAQGITRIGGFGRASFSAASQALILAIFITQQTRRKLFAVLVWLAAGAAITVTTSKGVILAYLVLSLYFSLRAATMHSNRLLRHLNVIGFNAFIVLVFFAIVALPVSTLFIQYHVHTNGFFSRLIFQSSEQRLSISWPAAFALLKSDTAVLFGNGLGGMGVAQQFFDLPHYNAGDNLFVFLTVQYGCLITLAVLVLFMIKFLAISRRNSLMVPDAVFLALGIFLIVYACFLNELEEGFLSFAFGLCVAYRPPWRAQAATR